MVPTQAGGRTVDPCPASPFLFLQKDPAGPEVPSAVLPGAQGVYVLHEGNYGDPIGARISLFDFARDSILKDIVESANQGTHLGVPGRSQVVQGNCTRS